MFGVGSKPDPFTQIVLNPIQTANMSLSGKTTATVVGLNPATTGVFVVCGQSISANSVITGSFTPTNTTKVFNLNAYDGGITLARNPLNGCSGLTSTFCSYVTNLADNLVTVGKYANVIVAPVAVAGSSIEYWTPGGFAYDFPTAAAQRLRWRGFEVTAFLWDQGTSNIGTPQATYLANLNQVIDRARSNGFNAPWVISKSTLQSDFSTVPTVRAACAEIVNNVNIFAGPDLDAITTVANREVTSLPHFNQTGAAAAAVAWTTSIQALP